MIGVLLVAIPLRMVDSLNPATLTIGACLTLVDRLARALRANISAVCLTYFSVGAAATLGPAATIRTVLTGQSSGALALIRVIPGLLLVAAVMDRGADVGGG